MHTCRLLKRVIKMAYVITRDLTSFERDPTWNADIAGKKERKKREGAEKDKTGGSTRGK